MLFCTFMSADIQSWASGEVKGQRQEISLPEKRLDEDGEKKEDAVAKGVWRWSLSSTLIPSNNADP